MWASPGSHHSHDSPSNRAQTICVVSVVLNLLLLWLLTMSRREDDEVSGPYVYSPAENVVQHKLVKFTRGLDDDIPIYERRPSAAVDDAWSALYSVAQIKLSRTEAIKLPNRTWPLSDRESYVSTLDIFHQLHCLDTLRKQASTGYNYHRVSGKHIRHCIGVLRQALMCSADITTVVWQWSEKLQIAEQRDDIVHVCRDFDQIREWADQRTFLDLEVDFSVYIDDDLTVSGGRI
ncbi:hypothetical protein DFH06DRAFT_1203397 [Mycena polygramma]|nr:hypothetical protein DFH06DRAFT_1203397 [Mycena polygramma]